MFSEPCWDVEDGVNVVTEHSLAQCKTDQNAKNKNSKKKKDESNKELDVDKHNESIKKSKNKYKALYEEQKKLNCYVKKPQKIKKSKDLIKSKAELCTSSISKVEKDVSGKPTKNPKKNISSKENMDNKNKLQIVEKSVQNNRINNNLKIDNNNTKNNLVTNNLKLFNNHESKNNANNMDKIKEKKSIKRKLNRMNKKNNLINSKKPKLDNVTDKLDKEKHIITNKKTQNNENNNSDADIGKDNLSKKENSNNKEKVSNKEKIIKNKNMEINKKSETNKKIDKIENSVIKNIKANTKSNNLDRTKLQKLLQQASASKAMSISNGLEKVKGDITNETECYDRSGDSNNNGEGNDGRKDNVLSKGKALKDKMLARLESARFRYLNEHLYTTSSQEAVDLFHQDPQSFHAYHEGFTNQVEKWSMNPVELMVKYINAKSASLKVADFGCGDAKLAAGISNQEVHSFDLVALNDRVTVADIRRVPLKTSSMNIVVFCLSLMGTNLNEYLAEASRVLKMEGILLIAEVVSRFEKIGTFIKKLNKLGFYLLSKNDTNKMFVWFELRKMEEVGEKEKLVSIQLAPCVYKKR